MKRPREEDRNKVRLHNPRKDNPIVGDVLGGFAGGAGYAVASHLTTHYLKKKQPRRRAAGGSAVDAVTNAPRATSRQRNLIRLHNPGILATLFGRDGRRGAAAAKEVFENFRGRASRGAALVDARPGTPSDLAELGGLVELVLDGDGVNVARLRAIGLDVREHGYSSYKLRFNSARVKLAADAGERMHIVGFFQPAARLQPGREYFLGDVVNVVYRADKRHLDPGTNTYTHDFCEYRLPGEEYPRLFYKDGYLFFRGGSYRITRDGIDG